MFRSGTYRHNYPFGWRTDDPLLYIAKTAWFVRTTAFKRQLLANNEKINWVPETIKYGRFGNWLENNVGAPRARVVRTLCRSGKRLAVRRITKAG